MNPIEPILICVIQGMMVNSTRPYVYKLDVRGSVHHSTILTVKKPNKMQQCITILLFLILNEAQHVSGDTPPIIGSLKLHKKPLVLRTWKVQLCNVQMLDVVR